MGRRGVWPWLAGAGVVLIFLFVSLRTANQLYFLELADLHLSAPPQSRLPKAGPCTSTCSCLLDFISERASVVEDNQEMFHFLSTSSVWDLHETHILNATFRKTEVVEEEHLWPDYQRWIRYLFSQAASRRLRNSVQPSTFPSLDILMPVRAILEAHWKQPDSSSRPLQIVVLGGSLTAGHGCQANPIGLPSTGILQRQVDCAWPSRLESMLNTLVGVDMVNITNLAMAATTSDVGATVVEYELWPEHLIESGGPDVIVAAFATNDALSILSGDASSRREVIDKMQSLLVQVQKHQYCTHKPLLMIVNDFNMWPGNLTEWLSFHQDVSTLVEWYRPNAWLVDYHRSFSDFVYASWKDANVKGKWEWRPRKRLVVGEAHPGMVFHITMAWTVLYNILALALESCAGDQGLSSSEHDEIYTDKFTLPPIPSGPRPPLISELKTEDIPNMWRKETDSSDSKCRALGDVNRTTSRCAFAWVANRLSDCPTAASIQAKLEPLLTHNSGWKAEGNSYRSKHAWTTDKPNTKFGMRVSNLTSDVNVISILSVVSYGERWQGSRVRVTMKTANDKSSSFDISGIHSAETSVIVPHKFELPKSHRYKSPLEVEFHLVGGSSFQIAGMAFC